MEKPGWAVHRANPHAQGRDSIENVWLEIWPEKSIEFWLKIKTESP